MRCHGSKDLLKRWYSVELSMLFVFPSIFALDNNENLELSKVGRRLKSNGVQI